MGGTSLPVSIAGALAVCGPANARFESDLQSWALLRGYKVPRWVLDVAAVPVRYGHEGLWMLLDHEGERHVISAGEAMRELHHVYGIGQVEAWREDAARFLDWRCDA